MVREARQAQADFCFICIIHYRGIETLFSYDSTPCSFDSPPSLDGEVLSMNGMLITNRPGWRSPVTGNLSSW